MVRETALTPTDFIYPLFVIEGQGRREPIASMPGQSRLSIDLLVKEAGEVQALGIPAMILFGIPAKKDERGSSGFDPDGIVQRASAHVKKEVPDLVVITDVCIDEYTSHGHCGIVREGKILNDETLDCLTDYGKDPCAGGSRHGRTVRYDGWACGRDPRRVGSRRISGHSDHGLCGEIRLLLLCALS